MDNTSQEFGLFIDNIRRSRNMSREDFVDGIISTRQFQRYLKGESSISIKKIVMLIDKLELEFFAIYNCFTKSTNNEYNIINNIYTHIMQLEYKEAYIIITKYKDYDFSSLYYQKIFNLYNILINHKLLRISDEMAINHIEKNIDYSNVMKTKELNFVELTALLYISQIVKDESKCKNIITKLYDVIKYNKISNFNETKLKMITIYSSFSKLLGIQKEYKKVIFITKKGIGLCEESKTTTSLAHLYYYCSLAYLGQNNEEKALDYARKTFFTLEIENVESRYKVFIKRFEEHFNIKFKDFKTW